jgi:hypothetical protein
MMGIVKRSIERLLGRGEAAITVPPMDGPLKPNHRIDQAEIVATFDAPEDLAWDGSALWVADGRRLLRRGSTGDWSEQRVFERPITAIAHVPQAGIVAAIGGDELCALADSGAWAGRRSVAGKPMHCLTALSAARDGSLIATDGSGLHPPDAWSRDLMSLGRSGRVLRLTPDTHGDAELAAGLHYAFGALEQEGMVWASESWAHRVVAIPSGSRATGSPSAVTDRLPAYPSRLAHAAGGGAWLTLFAARTRLVEFVLREREFRGRMMNEVDPRYWIAPGGVKQLGIVKPWAPPRSYGMALRLDARGLPVFSLHSRADGRHHGIVAVAEAGDSLYLLSKGSGCLVRLGLDAPATAEEA